MWISRFINLCHSDQYRSSTNTHPQLCQWWWWYYYIRVFISGFDFVLRVCCLLLYCHRLWNVSTFVIRATRNETLIANAVTTDYRLQRCWPFLPCTVFFFHMRSEHGNGSHSIGKSWCTQTQIHTHEKGFFCKVAGCSNPVSRKPLHASKKDERFGNVTMLRSLCGV